VKNRVNEYLDIAAVESSHRVSEDAPQPATESAGRSNSMGGTFSAVRRTLD
jgi:hypothetical protein